MNGGIFAGTADRTVWDKAVAAGFTGTSPVAREWLATGDLPEAVGAVLRGAGEPWASLAPILVVPEHAVPLPGGSMAAHGDVFCLGRHDTGLMSLAIEGKTEEGFGADLTRWQREMPSGRKTRLAFLSDLLGVTLPLPGDLRYQFLARMAGAVIEAQRFHAGAATLLVQSFSPQNTGFADFARFASIMGASGAAIVNVPVPLGKRGGIERYAIWVGAK